MIIVNDGSTDNSGLICKEYAQIFPNNIIYIEQENNGKSSSRNTGMLYADGEYVNFLDGGDSWEIEAFEKVELYFKKMKQTLLRAEQCIKEHKLSKP